MKVGIASTVILLAMMPATHGLPGSSENQQRDEGAFAPRQYNAYDPSNGLAYGHYSYDGYGPQPTVSSTSAEASSVSGTDGASTSVSVSYASPTSSGDPSTPSLSQSPSVTSGSTVILSTANTASTLLLTTGISEPLSSVSSDDPATPSKTSGSDGLATSGLPSPYLIVPYNPELSTIVVGSNGGASSSSSTSSADLSLPSYDPSSTFQVSSNDGVPTTSSTTESSAILKSSDQASSSIPLTSEATSATQGLSSSTFSSADGASTTSPLDSASPTTSGSSQVAPSGVSTTALSSIPLMYPPPIAKPTDCHRNNCFRQLFAASSGAKFCATYTANVSTATTGLPKFVSQCGNDPSKVSSACSCVETGRPALSTSGSSIDGTVTNPATTKGSSSSTSVSNLESFPTIVESTSETGPKSSQPMQISSTSSSSPSYSDISPANNTSGIISPSTPSTVGTSSSVGSSDGVSQTIPASSGATTSPDGVAATSLVSSSSIESSEGFSPSSSVPYPLSNATTTVGPTVTGSDTTHLSRSTVTITVTVPAPSSTPYYPAGNSSAVFGSSSAAPFSSQTFSNVASTAPGTGVSSDAKSTLSPPYQASNSSAPIYITGPTAHPSSTGTKASSNDGLSTTSTPRYSCNETASYPLATGTSYDPTSTTSGGISSSDGVSTSAPYPTGNTTLDYFPSGTGASSSNYPSVDGKSTSAPYTSGDNTSEPYLTGTPNSSSGFSSADGASTTAPYPTGNTTAGNFPTDATRTVGPLSTELPYSTASYGFSSPADTSSAPYPVGNNTFSAGSSGIGGSFASDNNGISTSFTSATCSSIYPSASSDVSLPTDTSAPYSAYDNQTFSVGPTGIPVTSAFDNSGASATSTPAASNPSSSGRYSLPDNTPSLPYQILTNSTIAVGPSTTASEDSGISTTSPAASHPLSYDSSTFGDYSVPVGTTSSPYRVPANSTGGFGLTGIGSFGTPVPSTAASNDGGISATTTPSSSPANFASSFGTFSSTLLPYDATSTVVADPRQVISTADFVSSSSILSTFLTMRVSASSYSSPYNPTTTIGGNWGTGTTTLESLPPYTRLPPPAYSSSPSYGSYPPAYDSSPPSFGSVPPSHSTHPVVHHGLSPEELAELEDMIAKWIHDFEQNDAGQ